MRFLLLHLLSRVLDIFPVKFLIRLKVSRFGMLVLVGFSLVLNNTGLDCYMYMGFSRAWAKISICLQRHRKKMPGGG